MPEIITRIKLLALGIVISITLWVGIISIKQLSPERIQRGWNTVDTFFYDLFFLATNHAPKHLIIIDSADPEGKRSRGDYADLVDSLFAAGAKVVAFDMIFVDDRERSATSQLARLSEEQSVVHAFRFFQKNKPSTKVRRGAIEKFALNLNVLPESSGAIQGNAAQAPCKLILDNAMYAGHVNFLKQDIRYLPMRISYEANFYPAFSLEVVRRYLNVQDENFEIEQDLITLKKANQTYKIPTDDYGLTLINFINLEQFNKYYYWQAAWSKLNYYRNDFKNAIILVVNSEALDDLPEASVPSGEGVYPHWAFHASMISQILNDKHIEESLFHNLWLTELLVFLSLVWLFIGEPHIAQKWRRPLPTIFILNSVFGATMFIAFLAGQKMWVVVPLLVLNTTYLVSRYLFYKKWERINYVDFDILVSKSANKIYPVTVTSSQTGQASSTFKSFIDHEKFQNVLHNLKVQDANRSDFSSLGEHLFHSIFSGDIRLLYERMIGRTAMTRQNLRIKLRIDAREYRGLPWEFLYGRQLRYSFLALSKNISIVRHVPTKTLPLENPVSLPLKILIVVSNPIGLPLLDVDEEKNAITNALKSLQLTRAVQVTVLDRATLHHIEETLNQKFHILHYIGHSDYDAEQRVGRLALEHETDDVHWVDAHDFGMLLSDSSIRLVIMNSCESAVDANYEAFVGLAPKLISAGIPSVIAMQYKIPDEVAIIFARAFYRAFAKNLSIDAALNAARRAIVTRRSLSQQHWATPVLFVNGHDTSMQNNL